ncbi:MAG TPA: hypothetical protein VLJ59_01680 [Mycobacteriales bacterium]|nr:hypothetical protein [Mycobacteriales bacterium]
MTAVISRRRNVTTGKACDIAEECSDPTLRANVLASMSLRATYDDNAPEAVDLAQVAEDVARPAATPRVMSLLAMRSAFAFAALGDRRGSHASLARSERLLAQTSDGDDDPAWSVYFTEPKLLADLGIARARLGEYAPAVSLIEAALDRQGHRNHRLRAFHALWLARAHLCLGSLDEDVRLVCEQLSTPSRLSRRLAGIFTSSARRFGNTTTTRRSVSTARDFSASTAAALRYLTFILSLHVQFGRRGYRPNVRFLGCAWARW